MANFLNDKGPCTKSPSRWKIVSMKKQNTLNQYLSILHCVKWFEFYRRKLREIIKEGGVLTQLEKKVKLPKETKP